jgi:hypothetical protein
MAMAKATILLTFFPAIGIRGSINHGYGLLWGLTELEKSWTRRVRVDA